MPFWRLMPFVAVSAPLVWLIVAPAALSVNDSTVTGELSETV
jgi:hypothetical protein